jgi:hypothetical protein
LQDATISGQDRQVFFIEKYELTAIFQATNDIFGT